MKLLIKYLTKVITGNINLSKYKAPHKTIMNYSNDVIRIVHSNFEGCIFDNLECKQTWPVLRMILVEMKQIFVHLS